MKELGTLDPRVYEDEDMLVGYPPPAFTPAPTPAPTPSPTYDLSFSQYFNPGNVEKTEGWAGAIPNVGYGDKDRFAIFSHPVMGIRALGRDIQTKIKSLDGDLSAIISKYAPPFENPTNDYTKYVTDAVGKSKVAEKDIPAIIKAIIEFENDSDMAKGYLQKGMMKEAMKLVPFDMPAGTTLPEARELAK